MTQERALAVLALGAQWSNYSDHMTPEEIAYVKAGWNVMPGWTCFYDAVVRVSQQRHPFNADGLLADVLHATRTA
jgi:hypothetical protein